MAGRSYSIRGTLSPRLGSMQHLPKSNLAQLRIPQMPKAPNKIPSSISVTRYKSQRS